MLDWLLEQSALGLALYATLFTWGMTALGAGTVFFFKTIHPQLLNCMLGFASGVMIAASFWSLLQPAIALAETSNTLPAWLIVALGFACGALFLLLADKLLSVFYRKEANTKASRVTHRIRRCFLLVFSITLHNIPEGLAIGVAFGAINGNITPVTLLPAVAVAIGIGIQNFPEGAAVAIPLRREGMSRKKAFLYGQASGIVEPLAATIGVLLVLFVQTILPYALAFAAGAMIYVVAEELLPEAQDVQYRSTHLATMGVILGFIVMMVLDVALG